MKSRYLIIEPIYSDPDTFCRVTVGGERVRASIQIYVDEQMVRNVIEALIESQLTDECPIAPPDEWWFNLFMSVIPGTNGGKYLRIRIWNDLEKDGTPFRSDIRLELNTEQATEIAAGLEAWLANRDHVFFWKD